MTFIPFPSIGQFREVVRHINDVVRYVGRDENNEPIFDPTAPLPKLKLTGTVKVHGTNAAINRVDGVFKAQSRSRYLPYPSDNYGFRTFMDKIVASDDNKISALFLDLDRVAAAQGIVTDNKIVTIFGEWAGRGIQTTVSVSEVDPFFYVFAAKSGEDWIDTSDLVEFPESRIFNSAKIAKYEIEVDFADKISVANAQNFMQELTLKVEEDCPVGKFLKGDVVGSISTGEGVVYQCADFDPKWKGVLFKVKGEKHSHSKVKVMASVDVEKIQNTQNFVEYAVTENRLQRGIDALREAGKEISKKSTGDFVSWICRDVIKEEMDTIQENGLDTKAIGNSAGTKAREWLFKYLDTQSGL